MILNQSRLTDATNPNSGLLKTRRTGFDIASLVSSSKGSNEISSALIQSAAYKDSKVFPDASACGRRSPLVRHERSVVETKGNGTSDLIGNSSSLECYGSRKRRRSEVNRQLENSVGVVEDPSSSPRRQGSASESEEQHAYEEQIPERKRQKMLEATGYLDAAAMAAGVLPYPFRHQLRTGSLYHQQMFPLIPPATSDGPSPTSLPLPLPPVCEAVPALSSANTSVSQRVASTYKRTEASPYSPPKSKRNPLNTPPSQLPEHHLQPSILPGLHATSTPIPTLPFPSDFAHAGFPRFPHSVSPTSLGLEQASGFNMADVLASQTTNPRCNPWMLRHAAASAALASARTFHPQLNGKLKIVKMCD